ncbi:MAG TPA: hypothetical protein VE175_01575 [Woeseiaceae bacterium]|nr:hypothetical protein [Woeseiaceae bacterium]
MKPCHSRSLIRRTFLALIATVLWLPVAASASAKHPPWGTWFLALDAAPYGLPEGLVLPGLMTLHSDRTVLLSDGGDFGGMPLNARDSSQFGSWRYTKGHHIKVVTLFLQADLVGDVRSWFRVQFKLRQKNSNTLVGTVNVYQLACDLPAPFAAFSCPDPIEAADDFVRAEGPVNVPITFRRLRPRFIAPD